MGHIRLGRLPKSARWSRVVGLMTEDDGAAARIAASTVVAAEEHLRDVAQDGSLTQAYWLLVRLMSASRAGRLSDELSQIGVTSSPADSSVAVIAALSEHLRSEVAEAGTSSSTADYAALAFRRALMETVATQADSLFGGTVNDLERAFRSHSSERQFGEVSQKFFGDFVARILTSALDREIQNQFASASAATELLQEIDLHARQTAAIVRHFAGEWLSKQGWETGNDIQRDQADRFIAVALRKLRSELKREAAAL